MDGTGLWTAAATAPRRTSRRSLGTQEIETLDESADADCEIISKSRFNMTESSVWPR